MQKHVTANLTSLWCPKCLYVSLLLSLCVCVCVCVCVFSAPLSWPFLLLQPLFSGGKHKSGLNFTHPGWETRKDLRWCAQCAGQAARWVFKAIHDRSGCRGNSGRIHLPSWAFVWHKGLSLFSVMPTFSSIAEYHTHHKNTKLPVIYIDCLEW